MSGSPATKARKKVYAYLLVDVAMEKDEKIDAGSYLPQDPPMKGTITLREDNPGTGTHPFIFEDGPFKFICSGVYIGTGEETETGGVEFDWGVSSLIKLIMLGADAANAQRVMLHEFADQIKAIAEEENGRFDGEGIGVEPLVKAIDDLERNWFKVR